MSDKNKKAWDDWFEAEFSPVDPYVSFCAGRSSTKDPRDSNIYKLILKHHKELEAQVCSDKRVIKDLLAFNYSTERKVEIVVEHLEKIEDLFNSQMKELNNFDLRDLI